MKLDILAFAAHPDDTELSCAGTIASHVAMGKKVGVVDFTQGEMGTRGSSEIRAQEAAASAKILGLTVRKNLYFDDAFFVNDKDHQLDVVRAIRKFKPSIILANAIKDRHPDHGKASQLVVDACFLAGLTKVETQDDDGNNQDPWRPKAVYHYIQSIFIQPDFVVDVSDHWDTKMKAIKAFKSQFYDPNSDEPDTYISSPQFMEMLESRGKELGHSIGVNYGEGFTIDRNMGVKNLEDLL
ncbi:bacillithiol biosynthesis deacetylase BshB1 [Fulvivirga sp. RKSG066]|uniref:bacillithiol biosynthesis deacetylase BshB1 n=1 Tax=Fulvivirga aurantia TaxID=2529383 RepID=UPI0012BC4BDE|nr:bacillithiol biosynthesis deacetylase BshB1 [Fulvivirga aurantia]MTI21866.1 bacillithiol biosynthesis deacetylase BshB1 [Fulvivirga aurantia]